MGIKGDNLAWELTKPFDFYWRWVRVIVFNSTFNNIFSHIVAISFIDGGNQRTCRKPLTLGKSLTNFIT